MSSIEHLPKHIMPANDMELFHMTCQDSTLLDDSHVMHRFGYSLQQLASLYQNNAILGVMYKGDLVFPSMQFDENGVSPYFRTLLNALPHPLTGLDRLYFFMSPILFMNGNSITPASYRHQHTESQNGAHEMNIILQHANVFTRNKVARRQ